MAEINRFSFATSQQVIFGPGAIEELKRLLPGLGKNALLLTNRTFSLENPVAKNLLECQIPFEQMVITTEPDPECIKAGLDLVRKNSLDLVISIGGGSVLDAGKAIAMLAANGGDLYDYIEVIGNGFPITRRSIPFIAIPTTTGTGSEVTRNAVISLPEQGVKASLRSDHMFPTVAIIDPELTVSLSPLVTAYTGMDALTQVIEPYLSLKANHFVDTICQDAINLAYHALEKAFLDGKDMQARTDMAYVSLIGGFALTNAGLGAVHGLAAAIGGAYDIPHGMICGILLPGVLNVNWQHIKNDPSKQDLQIKLYRIAKSAGFVGPEGVDQFILSIFELKQRLGIKNLSDYGIQEADLPGIVEKAQNASSMKANPIKIPAPELLQLLKDNL